LEEILKIIKEKFPIVCKNPYNKEIISCLKKGHSAYSINKWLCEREAPISTSRLTDLKNFLLEQNLISENPPNEYDKFTDTELFSEFEKQLMKAIISLDVDNLNDNVKVQWILGALKFKYGNKLQIDMDARTENKNTHEMNDDVLKVLSNALERRNNK